MICEKCKRTGKKSKVFPKGSQTTLMAWSGDHFDENGNFVNCDGNTRTELFECSNGHRWQTNSQYGKVVATLWQ
jgi:hypothetical protein